MPYKQNKHPILRSNINYITNNKQFNSNCATTCILTLNPIIESNT